MGKLKLLNLMRPAMALLPEVDQPDRKVPISNEFSGLLIHLLVRPLQD